MSSSFNYSWHPHFLLLSLDKLNNKLLQKTMIIGKASVACALFCRENYILLPAGMAWASSFSLPIITRKGLKNTVVTAGTKVGVADLHSTGAILLRHFFPQVVMLSYSFKDLVNLVVTKKLDAAVIVHETGTKYLQMMDNDNLQVSCDLGSLWRRKYRLPLPLGGWVVRRDYKKHISSLLLSLTKSLNYAHTHPDTVMFWMRQYAQEDNSSILRQHVRRYCPHVIERSWTTVQKKSLRVLSKLMIDV